MSGQRATAGKWIKWCVLLVVSSGLLLVIAFVLWVWSQLHVPRLNVPATATNAERVALADAWLRRLQENGKFNGAVLILHDGNPLLMKAFGFTDHTAREPLTTQSSFRLASVSKQFTAAGVLICAERGLLDLDRPVTDYLEDFPYRDVTVRHLLNQTSGVPDLYMSLAEEHREEVGEVLTLSEAVELVNRYPTQADSPGEAYAYSNTNYVLLARLIEIVSNRTFDQFMGEELFQPLRMKNSRIWNLASKDSTFPNKTSDFDHLDQSPIEPSWLDGVAGDGAVFSSIEDFVIWDEFWRGNDLISEDLLSQAFEKPKLNDGSLSDYGFGWVLTEGGAWHNGEWLGAATYISRGVRDRHCLVVLDNSSNLVMDEIVSELERVFFRE